MKDCGHYRRAILADPRGGDEDLRRHLASCHDCTRYAEQVLRFEARLDRALQVNVESGATSPGTVTPLRSAQSGTRHPDPRYSRRRRWFAAAASVLLGSGVALSLWLAAPGRSLAADVVAHMAEEPDAWARTGVPVPEPKLDEVLTASHMRLNTQAGLVSYANSCGFRGHTVPHLVVQTGSGPVTVMVLTHETLRSPVRFDEGGYRGVILPVRDHGSLAVLERGSNMDIKYVEAVAARVLHAIDWTS